MLVATEASSWNSEFPCSLSGLDCHPRSFGRRGSFYEYFLVRNGMLEADAAGMEADAAVWVTARSTIFQVASDGATYGCQLAADLVVASCVEVYFEQVVAVGVSDNAIVQHSFLGVRTLGRVGEALVFLLVAHEVVRQCDLFLVRRVLHQRPVCLLNTSVAELTGANENEPTGDGEPKELADFIASLERGVAERLRQLSPEELAKVDAFAQGIIASRKE